MIKLLEKMMIRRTDRWRLEQMMISRPLKMMGKEGSKLAVRMMMMSNVGSSYIAHHHHPYS